eukprot:9282043-Ditylum_brightwellii.AAC.1
MDGINCSKDTNKDIKEEAIKKKEVDKVAVTVVNMVVVQKEKETSTLPCTAGHMETVPIGVMVANTRHKDKVMKQCSKTGWEVSTGILTAGKGNRR